MGLTIDIPPIQKTAFSAVEADRAGTILRGALRARGGAEQGKTDKKERKMSKKSRKTRRRELKTRIYAVLEEHGANDAVHADRAEEYLTLWDIREDLKEDIEENGATQYDAKRGMDVENRSVSLIIQTSRQMSSLYQLLGLEELSGQGAINDEL